MTKQYRDILLGLVLFVLVYFIAKTTITKEQAAALGTLALMACWWVTMCLPVGITAFVPVLVNALFSVIDMDRLLANYGSETVMLLMGSSMLAYSFEKTGLDRRISLYAVSRIGVSLKSQIVVWFLLAVGLSLFIPKTVAAAILLPIAVSMLRFVGEEDLSGTKDRVVGASILSAIVWGVSIGGTATPLGGSMNLVGIRYIEELLGREYLFAEWTMFFGPMTIVLALICLAVILLETDTRYTLSGSKSYFRAQLQKYQVVSKEEKVCFSLFITVIVLAFTREWYAGILPDLKPAYIFLAGGLLTMMIPIDQKNICTWKEMESHLLWGTVFMFAGGMALGEMIADSGITDTIAAALMSANITDPRLLLVMMVGFTILVSELSNDTSAAAICVPLTISIFQGLGEDPFLYVLVICLAFNSSYMLPTTFRSLAIGYGLSTKYLLKKGALLTLLSWLFISSIGCMIVSVF